MLLPKPLLKGRLILRYKRFLADIELDSGELITAHCANPGAMTGLKEPGTTCYISTSDSPTRKLKHSLELMELEDGTLVGINTSHPNRIIGEALANKQIPELAHYNSIRAEVKYGEKSRVDFLLQQEGYPDCYLEIKNAHLSRTPHLAEFPDAVTARGAKHLRELSAMTEQGHRAVLLYLVQRTDCNAFTLASDIDPTYANTFKLVQSIDGQRGVETLCYATNITLDAITVASALPILSLGY